MSVIFAWFSQSRFCHAFQKHLTCKTAAVMNQPQRCEHCTSIKMSLLFLNIYTYNLLDKCTSMYVYVCVLTFKRLSSKGFKCVSFNHYNNLEGSMIISILGRVQVERKRKGRRGK